MVATGEQSLTTTLVLPTARDALYKSTGTITSFADRVAQELRTQQEDGSLHAALKSDLKCLLEGTVKCTKPKPPSTEETRKEAFDRYMKILYRIPHNIKVDFDEDSDEITFEPEQFANTPYFTPVAENRPIPPQIIIPPIKTKKKKRKKKKPALVDEDEESEEEPEPVVNPFPPVIRKKPALVKVATHNIHEKILPKVPTPPPRKPAPVQKPSQPETQHKDLPPPTASPEPPAFLQEFLSKEWYKQLYPDNQSIPSSLSPDSFFLQLSDYLCTCNAQYKSEILSALETLHKQNPLQNVDQLYQKLLNTVPKMVTPNMGASEQAVLIQLLTLLMGLKPVNEEIVKTLLTLKAYKDLGLRDRMLRMLKSLGVDEAEEFLQPELENWESELLSKCNMWTSLYAFADSWLRLWTAKYKDHVRDLFLRSTEKWPKKPPSFTAVDVLNHFCAVQKKEYLEAKQVAPRANNTVLLPCECSSRPIHRLGETYTMARRRKPSNLILPPLRDRPFLLRFPNYISLPLPRVTLSPFYTDSEEDRLKFLNHRYYVLEKSHVKYYR